MFALRPATAADQPVITAIVREAGINPRDLDWPRFIVAEREGQVIGVGQVKPHGDGSRELASIAVRPEYQGQGIGSAICRALIERESGILHLITISRTEAYYHRFGFRKIGRDEMPPHFRRMFRIASALKPVLRLAFGVEMVVMRPEPPS